MQLPLALLPSGITTLLEPNNARTFLEEAIQSLGFDYFAYGWRAAYPLSTAQATIISNYPDAWQQRYLEAEYIKCDPTIAASRKSMRPLVWSNDVFANAKPLWSEACDAGLRIGCAQFIIDGRGNKGMLTLARKHEVLTDQELQAKEAQIHWLSVLIHEHFQRVFLDQSHSCEISSLTEREIEVLRWSADGKIAAEIAVILQISINTVNFHLKKVLLKLAAPNKTAAILRAALNGLLE